MDGRASNLRPRNLTEICLAGRARRGGPRSATPGCPRPRHFVFVQRSRNVLSDCSLLRAVERSVGIHRSMQVCVYADVLVDVCMDALMHRTSRTAWSPCCVRRVPRSSGSVARASLRHRLSPPCPRCGSRGSGAALPQTCRRSGPRSPCRRCAPRHAWGPRLWPEMRRPQRQKLRGHRGGGAATPDTLATGIALRSVGRPIDHRHRNGLPISAYVHVLLHHAARNLHRRSSFVCHTAHSLVLSDPPSWFTKIAGVVATAYIKVRPGTSSSGVEVGSPRLHPSFNPRAHEALSPAVAPMNCAGCSSPALERRSVSSDRTGPISIGGSAPRSCAERWRSSGRLRMLSKATPLTPDASDVAETLAEAFEDAAPAAHSVERITCMCAHMRAHKAHARTLVIAAAHGITADLDIVASYGGGRHRGHFSSRSGLLHCDGRRCTFSLVLS